MTTPLASPGRVELVIFSYSGEPQRFPLPVVGDVRIGRDPRSNEIVIADATVSSNHAILTVDSRITVRDLGSLNGTSPRRRDIDMDITHTEQAHRSSGDSFVVEPGDRLMFGAVMSVIRKVPLLSNVRAGAGGMWPNGPIAQHPAMRAVCEEAKTVARAAPHACVLLLGETGVGKDVIARAIHDASPRASKPFVVANCAAIVETMFQREMFGHKRGTFTDAKFDAKGYFEAAAGGTLFLDEVGELSLGSQAILLRVLEDRRVAPVGSSESRFVDVRIIAATNRPLAEWVAQNKFRQDLYYRLRQFEIVIPPLRDRPDDIIPLAEAFLELECRLIHQAMVPRLSNEVVSLLMGHPFPGNVRELRRAMLTAVAFCEGDVVLPRHLPKELWDTDKTDPMVSLPFAVPNRVPDVSEEQRIRSALRETCNNVTRAAELLGKSRRWLNYKLDEYNIGRSRKSRTGTVVGGSGSRQTS